MFSCIGAVSQLILWFSGRKGEKEYPVDGTKISCNTVARKKNVLSAAGVYGPNLQVISIEPILVWFLFFSEKTYG